MGNLKILATGEAGTLQIDFVGSIDEAFDFPTIPPDAKKLIVDLDQVSYVSSIGVKNWVQWIAKLSPSMSMEFHRARYSVISNINSVHGFLPASAVVKSLFAPYIDDNGTESVEVLLEEGKHYFKGGKLSLPEVKGSKGTALEIDVIEAKFFRFLKV